MASEKPKTVSEIALYNGPDRTKILIEGAKKEGKIVFYTSNSWTAKVGNYMCSKVYPFLKMETWRTDSQKLLKRVSEEYAAKRYVVDVIELPPPVVEILAREGIFQEYYSPETVNYPVRLSKRGQRGVFYLADREVYIGLGFNKNIISPDKAPKSYKDLLDPFWKGKIGITGTDTGIRLVGSLQDAFGDEFIKKLSLQDISVQNVSGSGMLAMVISGEIPLSPCIYDFTVVAAKLKGAPVEWRPLEPVLTNVGFSGITTNAPNPHASMLFLDFLHSKEGQEMLIKLGLRSPRKDIGSLKVKFEKVYLEAKYPLDEYEKKFSEWENLMNTMFARLH